MLHTPTEYQDTKELLNNEGFRTSDVWYHGTSSALIDSIKKSGLKRSGDKLMKQAAKQTMATIGNQYSESIEPVFLTQSKALAYYWAEATVRNRSVRTEGQETPAIVSITLPQELNSNIKPDVGAASLLMVKEGEQFMAFVASLYDASGLTAPEIDLKKADRLEYLNKLGMAYYAKDIAAECISIL